MSKRHPAYNPGFTHDTIYFRREGVEITQFELKVAALGLEPDQLVRSTALKAWAQVHRHTRYVPECLLKAWGLGVTGAHY